MNKYDFILKSIPIIIHDTEDSKIFFKEFPKRVIGSFLIKQFGSCKDAKKHVNFIATGGRNSWNTIVIANDKYKGEVWEDNLGVEYRVENLLRFYDTDMGFFEWQDKLKKEHLRFRKQLKKRQP